MQRMLLAAALCAIAFGARAQAVPAHDYTDLWYNPNESGQGLSLTQSAASNILFALWYTFDPRTADDTTTLAGDFKPLWFSMSDGRFTSPTTATGKVYVTTGTPFAQPWNPGASQVQEVGTFTFTFTSQDTATFQYAIQPPTGLAATNPAFGLPAFSGQRSIQRLSF